MTTRLLAGMFVVLALSTGSARAADDAGIARMATCQNSWLDWKKAAPGKLKDFGDHFRSTYAQRDTYFVPKSDVSIAGLNVVQVFPDSVGMGVGFSVTVEAGFDKTRKVMEDMLGKRLSKCEDSDGMHSCELNIAEQRTFMVMADDNDNKRTLIGCYYLYEK